MTDASVVETYTTQECHETRQVLIHECWYHGMIFTLQQLSLKLTNIFVKILCRDLVRFADEFIVLVHVQMLLTFVGPVIYIVSRRVQDASYDGGEASMLSHVCGRYTAEDKVSS